MEGDKLRYSDIIQPDDSIERLIRQLGELNQSYEATTQAIKVGAERIIHALKGASGATSEGRRAIDDAAAATTRLEKAQKELEFAMSETGQQVAWLKAQTVDANKATVSQQRYIKQVVSSYDRLKADLKESVSLYKSLSAEERANSQMGQQLLQDIINLKNQVHALDAEMRPHIQTMSEVQKAEERLAFLESEEGQKLLELKARIAEVTRARRENKTAIDPLAQAQQKLSQAQSYENQQLKEYSARIKEANREAKLRAQIAVSSEGSYNRLSAQYALNVIELNKMSAAERSNTEAGKQLEAETYKLYQQMIKLQEATGNHRLSVGHYQRTWDGLGIAMSNVVRELPAATVSLNTFFLGISNNIPMVVDEVKKLRLQNKTLQAEGKASVSVAGSIVKSLVSWHSVLIVGLTLLAQYGNKIVEWVGGLFKAEKQIDAATKAQQGLNEELEKNGYGIGDDIIQLRKLSSDWKALGNNLSAQTKFIEDNKAAFTELGLSINDVVDAEIAFDHYTSDIIEALKSRARAAAAYKLAANDLEQALKLDIRIANLEKSLAITPKYTFVERPIISGGGGQPYGRGGEQIINTEYTRLTQELANAKESKKLAEQTADAYFTLAENAEKAASAQLEALGVNGKKSGTTSAEDSVRDLTDRINRMDLQVRKKHAKSITQLEHDENTKQRKETVDAYNAEQRELLNIYGKNRRILENQREDLTDKQIAQITDAQNLIKEIIVNNEKQLTYELNQIELDRQISEIEILNETNKLRLEAVKKGSDEELALRLQALENERQLAILANKKLPEGQRVSEADINSSYATKAVGLMTDYAQSDFEQQQALEEARFTAVKRTDKELTRFRLQQEKARWQEQVRLAKAGALDWSETQVDAAEATIEGINRELSELDDLSLSIGQRGLGGALLEKLGLDDDQISAMSDAVSIVIEQLQAIADAEVELAEKAVEAAEKRVDAAKSAYDAEVEARNNGYANNVAAARKDLELEKKNQAQKQKLLEQAQRRQEAINSIIQASSLITASANLWSSFSTIPIVGPALAVAAIALMWGSFAAAKIKAAQVTSSGSDLYGEGGLEFLEGGSHASGNDIDLRTKNKRGRNMRAEGGEALAIIRRRQARRYRRILPDIIDSLNKGIFEDKYVRAFDNSEGVNLSLISGGSANLSKLENDVQDIRKQNEKQYHSLPNGTVIVRYKNITRKIKS